MDYILSLPHKCQLTPVIASASALESEFNDYEPGRDRFEKSLVCRRYLLDAGCDPTIPCLVDSKPAGSFFNTCLSDGAPVCSL